MADETERALPASPAHLRDVADVIARAATANDLLIALRASDPEPLRRLAGVLEGFSWADVDLLRDAQTYFGDGARFDTGLLSLADRIAALLPPREDAADG